MKMEKLSTDIKIELTDMIICDIVDILGKREYTTFNYALYMLGINSENYYKWHLRDVLSLDQFIEINHKLVVALVRELVERGLFSQVPNDINVLSAIARVVDYGRTTVQILKVISEKGSED